jgi:predicted MFS family arabinose efflux permease
MRVLGGGGIGRKTGPSVGLLVLLVAALSTIHLISQFLRTSIGVIAPDLAREIGVSAAGIGLLASVFFLTFAAAQVPIGVAIDRFGPRLIMLVSTAAAVGGVVVFAIATSPELLILGRALMGLGCASFFMAPLVIYSRWFRPERFSTVVGLQLGFSGMGVLFATAPLAYGTAAIGWRASFLVVAAIAALVGLVVFLIARDHPPGEPLSRTSASLRESIGGLGAVWRTPAVFPVFAMQFAGYSTLVTVLGLWGGPYLTHVHGYDLAGRGDLLLLLAVVNVGASLAWGPTDRLFKSYKRPVLIGATATIASLIWIAAVGQPARGGLIAWLILFGAAASYTPVLTAHGRALFVPEHLGRGLTLLNLGTMAGVFVFQSLTGAVVNLFEAPGGTYPADAYRAAFATEAGLLAICTLIYLRASDPARGESS